MKFKEFKHEPVKPDTYEASMARNQLMRIGKHAIKLHNMIDDAAEMESWVAKKIDLAGDYVKKVYNYTEGEKAGLYDDGGMTESREQIGDYAREIKTGRIVRIVDYTDDDEGIYTISYGEGKGETDVTAKSLKFLDQTGRDQEEIGKFDEDASGYKLVSKAKEIAKKMAGNYTGAVRQIEKLQKDLSKNSSVQKALLQFNEDAGAMDWSTDKVQEFGDDLIKLAKGQVPSDDLEIDDLEDGWAGADQNSRDQLAETIGGRLISVLIGYLQFSAGQKPSAEDVKDAQEVVNDPEFKKAYHSTESVSEDAGDKFFDYENSDEYADNVEKYGDVDKTPLTPMERQQFAKWLMDSANDYAGRALEDGVEEIGDDLSDIEDQYHKFIPKIKQYLKQSHAKGNLEDFASDVLNVEEKFGDEDMLMNDEGYRVAKDFSQHAMNYEAGLSKLKSKGQDYTVKTIRGVLDLIDDDPHISSAMLVFQTDFKGTPLQRKVSRVQASESVSEDAGEGHMSKSTLYHTAKYAIELLGMIQKGDDLEGWVQSKLNKAADYLQGVYNYEEYQKLNPYREELNSDILQRHAGIVQKHIDEILAKETKLDDIDTKPGMMRILAKRVNEVEKEIAKEQRKNTDEAHGGQHSTSGRSMTKGEKNKREKIVKGMKKNKSGFKKRYGKDAEAVMYATATKNAMKDDEQYDEGIKDWAKKLAAAGVIVGAVAGMGSINNAIDNSVPAVQALNTAYELAVDQGHTDLANDIKKDLSAVKVRLQSGKDLNFVKDIQNKYSKFVDAGGLPYSIDTEGLAYESKLAVLLNQRLK
tara:strand:- start:1091 stop:3514 length:2424 start_codon:yes stop_codon:yes gene_type:complete